MGLIIVPYVVSVWYANLRLIGRVSLSNWLS